MVTLEADRSLYVPITGRRRITSLALVALLYLIAAVVLLNLPDRLPNRVVPANRTFVELLPLPEPPEPLTIPKVKPDPSDDAVGQQRLKPAPVKVEAPPRLTTPSLASAPLSAAIAPVLLPSAPDITPLASAPPALPPDSGGGDRIDNGSGGNGRGGNGAGGKNGGGGGGGGTQLTRAEWAVVPTPAELGRYHPSRAIKARIGGTAILACQVRRNMSAHNCQVLGESPHGYGFGRAALTMEPIFRIRPVRINRRPIDDGWVRVSIQFDFQ
ncbi:MAG: hypothetical protein C0500_09215 [Sphingobium sp.]|nr:hypothetical protein [Sphingobium sp.]